METKKYCIATENIRPLLTDWEGFEGCLISDRITVDGCKVGYMYRDEPDSNYPDSGWCFLAGDETEEYLDNPGNSGAFSLNTACNFDEDIIPLLNSPCGSAFYRDKKGIFREE